VNLRNDKQHYQDGLFMLELPTFNEGAVREAILNAVAHRDYRHPGSVFIRQSARRIEIVSPGGLPQGITPENILDRQEPRNRRIADVFGKCGLVERAGQGANRIFETCIREGKPLPDFTHTDAYQVSLTLHGEVGDPAFVRFLERIGRETATSFDTHDFLVLDLVHREEPVPAALRGRLRRLAELGVVESVGRGRGVRFLLARRFYAMTASRGAYTRRRGLDRETNKELLLTHLRENSDGSPMSELQEVLPGISRANVQRLLDELRRAGRVRLTGQRRGARWFAAGAGGSSGARGNEA
jgi:ATP-dependent DNA helicase RecG